MNDVPTGTSGLPAQSGGGGDLDVVLKGGPRFADRLQQLGAATDAHEDAAARHRAALDELALGQQAAAALGDAQAKQAEAIRVLDGARREAARLVSEAEARKQIE